MRSFAGIAAGLPAVILTTTGAKSEALHRSAIEHLVHRMLTLLDRVMLGRNRHPFQKRKRYETRNASRERVISFLPHQQQTP